MDYKKHRISEYFFEKKRLQSLPSNKRTVNNIIALQLESSELWIIIMLIFRGIR